MTSRDAALEGQPRLADEGAAGGRAAAGSSFYWAMRILPRAQRQAMFEIYAFCRAVDDIADGPASREQRSRDLQAWRDAIGACYAGIAPAAIASLAHEVSVFGLEQADFLAVIDGMQMDVDRDIRAPDWATLDLFCDRVASAVGRLSVRVFGIEGQPGLDLAHSLGRGLQLTNILRDLDEDASAGRLYLPEEALSAAHIESRDVQQVLDDPGVGHACATVAGVAQRHLDESHRIMKRLPRSRVRAPRVMEAVYRRILESLMRRGFRPPRRRVRLSRLSLAGVVLVDGLF